MVMPFENICVFTLVLCVRHDGLNLLVSALDSGSSGSGSSAGGGHSVVFFGQDTCGSLHPGEKLLGQHDKMLGVTCDGLANLSMPSSNIPSRLHATEFGISSASVGQFGSSAAVPFLLPNEC